jgi:hypothetical protein
MDDCYTREQIRQEAGELAQGPRGAISTVNTTLSKRPRTRRSTHSFVRWRRRPRDRRLIHPWSELAAHASRALGELDQHVMGGGQIVRVDISVQTMRDWQDRLRDSGVQVRACRGQLYGAVIVRAAATDQTACFEPAQELGNFRLVEAKLWLTGKVVMESR